MSSSDKIVVFTHANNEKEFSINGEHYYNKGDIFEINGEKVSFDTYMEGFNKVLENWDNIEHIVSDNFTNFAEEAFKCK